MDKKYLITIILIFSGIMIGNCQKKEQRLLNKMTSYFVEIINDTYQKSDSSFYYFIRDYIEEFENGERTEIVSNINIKKIEKINKKLKNTEGVNFYFYRNTEIKDFKNVKNLPDSIFDDFKIKYNYNVIKLSETYLDYYLNNNNSASSDYIKKKHEIIGELSPLTYSLFLKHRIEELKYNKNKELLTLLFWPYLCHISGLDFFRS